MCTSGVSLKGCQPTRHEGGLKENKGRLGRQVASCGFLSQVVITVKSKIFPFHDTGSFLGETRLSPLTRQVAHARLEVMAEKLRRVNTNFHTMMKRISYRGLLTDPNRVYPYVEKVDAIMKATNRRRRVKKNKKAASVYVRRNSSPLDTDLRVSRHLVRDYKFGRRETRATPPRRPISLDLHNHSGELLKYDF